MRMSRFFHENADSLNEYEHADSLNENEQYFIENEQAGTKLEHSCRFTQ